MPRLLVRGPSGPPLSHRFDEELIHVGRSSDNELVVNDLAVSRVHLRIVRQGDTWLLEDGSSMNGTRLNGKKLGEPVPLRGGDEITLGETVLVFDGGEGDGGDEVENSAADTAAWSSRGGRRDDEPPALVGDSPAMRALRALVDKVAAAEATVLVTGESGTGKELVARLLHDRSPRAEGPLVIVNCPALPGSMLEAELFGIEKGVATGVEPRRGRLEMASGGTVVLDEIGDMELGAQAKLLRSLQEHAFERVGGRKTLSLDVRFVAVTNRDLESAIASGGFRLDLYHRLNALRVELPPLRERREDIPQLFEHFRARNGSALSVSPEAMDLLLRHDFPGNVRELEHLAERAFLLADGPSILPEDLPRELLEGGPPSDEAAAVNLDGLRARIVDAGESFWDVVRGPYLRRELSREDVRSLVQHLYDDAGGSYRRMAENLRLGSAGYRKLLNFLNHHDLTVRRR